MSDRITSKDIYEAIERLDEKMDRRFGKLEGKVDGLESFRDKVYGIGAILVLFMGGLTTWVWDKIRGMK